LGFVIGLADVDQVVVGVESAAQLVQVVASAEPIETTLFTDLALGDPAFVEPSRWRVS
jgi:hypothetical protein